MKKSTTDLDEVIDRTEVATLKFDAETMHGIFGTSDLWPSWVADMDFRAAPEIIEALNQRVKHGVFGYEASTAKLTDAVVNWYQRKHGWAFDSSQIIFSPRTLNSLAVMITHFSEPGDGVIVQSPVFYDFKIIISTHKRKLVKNPLTLQDNRYSMDFEDLEAKAADSRNKLLILCNPHNPIGRVWSREELSTLADICARHDVFIIADEIHGDITYDTKYTPLASVSELAAANSATCISPVKSFNLAGLANSMMVITDDDKRKVCADWYSKMEVNKNFIFNNVAMQAAYTDGEGWLNEVIDYLKGNIDELRSTLAANMPQIKLVEPDGTFLVWLDFRELGLDARQLERFLSHDARMALNPGHWFGREGAGFARVNIACPRSVLQTALGQLDKAIKNLT
jgi:cysteine-S-conjugate beta-lyase